jgi:hypothetical protein
VTRARGDERDDGRPLDARQHLQHEVRHRHERAGVAGTHAGMRLVRLDQIERAAHRGVLLAPQCLARVIGHLDHLGGEDAVDVRELRGGDLPVELRPSADQGEPHVRETRAPPPAPQARRPTVRNRRS